MGVVVDFAGRRLRGRDGTEDAGARIARKLMMIRSDVRPKVEEILDDVLDDLLRRQAAGIARAVRGEA